MLNEWSILFCPSHFHFFIKSWIHEVYLSLVLKKIIKQLWQIWMSTSNKGNNCILLPFATVDNVYLRVSIWSITLSTIYYLYNEVYDNRMQESFPPKVHMTKLTNKKWKCEDIQICHNCFIIFLQNKRTIYFMHSILYMYPMVNNGLTSFLFFIHVMPWETTLFFLEQKQHINKFLILA
jgi:hypothetical protein